MAKRKVSIKARAIRVKKHWTKERLYQAADKLGTAINWLDDYVSGGTVPQSAALGLGKNWRISHFETSLRPMLEDIREQFQTAHRAKMTKKELADEDE